jgi:hypothetical protein
MPECIFMQNCSHFEMNCLHATYRNNAIHVSDQHPIAIATNTVAERL